MSWGLDTRLGIIVRIMINMILYVSENGQYYGNGMLLNIILYVAEN